jgi:transmembrane sensor
MTATDQRIRELITRQAADWFVGNRAGLGAHQRADFTAWLKASPVNIEEYLALAVVARDLRAACALSAESLDELITRARTEPDPSVAPLRGRDTYGEDTPSAGWLPWRTAALTFASVCVLTLGILALRNFLLTAPVARPEETVALHFATRHGEQQTFHLADDSVVHLNTDSAITVQFNESQRLVVLNAGEADFEVVHEPARAFKVLAGAARIVAIGTKFDVRLKQKSTVVAVVEGRVAVGPTPLTDDPSTLSHEGANTWAGSVQLGANQQISVSGDAWPTAAESIDTRQTTAWLHRQIMFQHEPLERVASEFNRYASTPFEITTPGLRTLEISGVFATDDTDAFIAFLRSLDGVRVEVTATRIRVMQE